MKRILLLLSAFFLIHSISFAQAPQGINYQGVARNASGAAIGMQSLGLRFTITQSASTIYVETNTTITDTFGLYNAVIGQGTAQTGLFNNINWALGNYAIQVEIDPGSGYQNVGTFPLMSVPFALYSQNAFNSSSIQGQPVSGAPPQAGDVLQYNAGIWSPATIGAGSVTSITGGTGITASPSTITTTGSFSLAQSGVIAGQYGDAISYPVITVDGTGRVMTASTVTVNNGNVVVAGTGLTQIAAGNTVTISAMNGTPIWSADKLQLTGIDATPPASGQVLQFNGTQWAPTNLAAGTVTSFSTGAGLNGGPITSTGIISADTAAAIWNARKVQGIFVDPTPPVTGEVLQYSGSIWTHAVIPGLPAPSIGSILFTDGSNTWNGTNPAQVSSDGNSITVVNTTTVGTAGTFISNNAGVTSQPALKAESNSSTGYALWADNQSGAAILATSQGPYAVTADLSAGGGNALVGRLVNGATGNAIMGINDNSSTGVVGYFENQNPLNASTVLSVNNQGTGFSGQFSGGAGLQTDKIQITATPALGYVLTSDAAGNGTWQPAGAGAGVASVTVNSPLLDTGIPSAPVINISQASGSQDGYLSKIDWTTFNNKGNGTVTSFTVAAPLTGGVISTTGAIGLSASGVISGPYGSATQVPTYTVDTFGRITNAANVTIAGALPAGVNGQVLYNSSGVWTPSNVNNLFFDGTKMGIGNSTPNANLDIVSTNTASALGVVNSGAVNSKAIYGKHTGGGVVYGVFGEATGSGGSVGVYGYASNAGGTNNYGVAGFNQSPTSGYGVLGQGFYGVYGQNNSSSGYGVYGIANTSGSTAVAGFSNTNAGKAGHFEITNASNPSDALYATTNGSGKAVAGIQTNATAVSYGVYGKNASPSGYAVYGDNTATTGNAYGVYGTSFSTDARAVYGIATNSTGQSVGVYGQTNSNMNGAFGIYGAAPAATGNITGVYGETGSNTGTGTWGYAANTTGVNYGVVGESESTAGYGVWGHAKATSGLNYGGAFFSESPAGYALYTQNNGGGITARLNGTVQITDGTQGANKIFTSDATGIGSWQSPSAAVFGGWDLLGNTGTSAATNFVGTKDAVDLVFRTGNVERLRINNTTFQLLVNNPGTQALPIFSWSADNNTGVFNPAADVLAFSTNGNERMRIDATGNVGIGTLSPINGKLDVQSTGATAAISAITTGSSNAGYFQVNSGANSATALFATHNGSGNTFLSTNTGTGHAGFFQVSNASNTLNAVFATTNGPGAAINATNTHSGANVLRDGMRVTATGAGGAGTTNTAGYFSASGASNNYAAIFDQGSVGIGTLSPASILHVYGTADPLQVTVENGGGAFKTGYRIKTAMQEWFIGKETGGSQGLRFSDITNGIPRMVIETSGNVGIAAMVPLSTLKVNGSIAGNFVNPGAANYVCTTKDYFVLISINGPVMLPLANSVDAGSVIIIRNQTGGGISVNAQGADMVFPLSCCAGGAPSATINGTPSPSSVGRYISDGIGKWFEW